MQKKQIWLSVPLLLWALRWPCDAFANNLSISDVSLTDPNATDSTIQVQFDMSLANSWRNQTNRDAAWVFVKYSIDSGVTWSHATLATAGTNPSGVSTGSGTGINIIVPTDKKGAFIERSANGTGTLDTSSIQLVWDYGTDGLTASSSARVKVFGIEMVYIPAASFYAGDNATSTASFKQGSADSDPWYITSASSISVTNAASDGYYYVSSGVAGEDATGSAFTISADFPKGYAAFYLMKYEATEGQYVDFLNTLTRAQQQTRVATTLTDTVTNVYVMTNTSSVSYRNNIRCPASGNGTTPPVVFSTAKSDRACNYLSWGDAAAFADWAALRPMTELEYEKSARGPSAVAAGEYAWGNTTITAAATISGTEDGTETITTSSANANYGGPTFSGGDASQGLLRAGIFATSSSTRTQAGAGYYGNMELSGNAHEYTVTVGNATGRAFAGTHGDGALTTATSYEGNATNSDWPYVSVLERGVIAMTGGGVRGGDVLSAIAVLAISNRSAASTSNFGRFRGYSQRAARTAP